MDQFSMGLVHEEAENYQKDGDSGSYDQYFVERTET
jgi:hypothetical protein